MRRLALLTSRTKETENKRIVELHPEHCNKLREAELTPESFPKLGEMLNKIDEEKRKGTKDKRKRSRQTWFCMGVSKIWKKPIHKKIKELKEKWGLSWLRFSMSHHRFPNIGQMFRGDLLRKVMAGIDDVAKRDRPCNCNRRAKRESDGTCMYRGRCREAVVIYEIKCKCCNMDYVGKTQRYGKTRTQEHIRDVWKLVKFNKERKERMENGELPEVSKKVTANMVARRKKVGSYLGLDSFA